LKTFGIFLSKQNMIRVALPEKVKSKRIVMIKNFYPGSGIIWKK